MQTKLNCLPIYTNNDKLCTFTKEQLSISCFNLVKCLFIVLKVKFSNLINYSVQFTFFLSFFLPFLLLSFFLSVYFLFWLFLPKNLNMAKVQTIFEQVISGSIRITLKVKVVNRMVYFNYNYFIIEVKKQLRITTVGAA
jgi:hypothetical protein